ncbi:ATP-binding protein [Embleya scabrispora]|uniref:ATP-binding protein n=1 Tax=Embleya scabrispora TaxID=159449 RepID=UPI00047810AE|nr:ATP-binding protein [Embleya scabrispora]MYS81876.1 ATP-binding protein [Streptomyces sp. SID5474]
MDRAIRQLAAPARTFAHMLSSTPRGARLARLLAMVELRSWDVPQDLTERAELVVAELAANAVLHGSPPGHRVRLVLVYDPPARRLRVEVIDARGDLAPPPHATAAEPDALTTGGRGLSLVTALVDHWDAVPHPHGGKTVRAVLSERAPRT